MGISVTQYRAAIGYFIPRSKKKRNKNGKTTLLPLYGPKGYLILVVTCENALPWILYYLH